MGLAKQSEYNNQNTWAVLRAEDMGPPLTTLGTRAAIWKAVLRGIPGIFTDTHQEELEGQAA